MLRMSKQRRRNRLWHTGATSKWFKMSKPGGYHDFFRVIFVVVCFYFAETCSTPTSSGGSSSRSSSVPSSIIEQPSFPNLPKFSSAVPPTSSLENRSPNALQSHNDRTELGLEKIKNPLGHYRYINIRRTSHANSQLSSSSSSQENLVAHVDNNNGNNASKSGSSSSELSPHGVFSARNLLPSSPSQDEANETPVVDKVLHDYVPGRTEDGNATQEFPQALSWVSMSQVLDWKAQKFSENCSNCTLPPQGSVRNNNEGRKFQSSDKDKSLGHYFASSSYDYIKLGSGNEPYTRVYLDEQIPSKSATSSPGPQTAQTHDPDENKIQRHFVPPAQPEPFQRAEPTTTEKSATGVIPKRSRDQIRRDLSRLGGNLRGANIGTTVVTDAENVYTSRCDRMYISGKDGIRNGTFESPNLAAEDGHSLQCIYLFVAKPNERVEITFREFNVRGTPPECVHEWVDIYTEVEDTDIGDLISTPFSGRYCGRIPPRRRISLYGGIAIGFYSDKNTTEDRVFRGTFTFFPEDRYIVGTPVPRTLCSYTIMSSVKRQGELVSPTYPGVYPKDLSCTYKFIGSPEQRLRLEFRDFDLFYGGAHCPFDDVKIYDGMEPTAQLIGTYCGQQRNLVVYSSSHLMLVTFSTLQRNTEAQNRGFSAVWEFSESFVKLDFIKKNAGEHIRGTECDQRILSTGRSEGNVYSPNYPFPYLTKIVCRYFIYGLQDPQHLERVRVIFDKFDVPSNSNVKNSEEDVMNAQHSPAKCGDGFLKVYVKGQEIIQAFDKADHEFCGKDVPHDVVSDGPRLVLVFSSGDIQGSGFKSKYVFETEYRVPGTAAPDGTCGFSYSSSTRKRGDFNSPRFPSNYPSMMNCTYMFYTEDNEQVRLVFDHFKVKSDKVNTTGGTYGEMCQEDWIEVYNVWKDREDRLLGRFCGRTSPGPLESEEGAHALRLVFHTDDEGVLSGFKARYIFFPAKPPNGDECGNNVTDGRTGVLTSPNWPAQYDAPAQGVGGMLTCNWFIHVRPGSRVMLHFQVFNIEGSPNDRGCPAAAVRVWEDVLGIATELCGEKLNAGESQYISVRNVMRLTFITAEKAVGAGGFKAVWTEVQDGSSTSCSASQFRCERSQFCIPEKLRCDGVYNCGIGPTQEPDESDEANCNGKVQDPMDLLLIVVLAITGFLSMVLVICIWAQRKRRKRRRRLQLRRPPIHVCDNAGARFAAMDSV